MITRAQEIRAERLVRQAIDRALARMLDYITRALLEGEEPDKRMMVAIVNGMRRIADEYAIDLTAGKWGAMIEEAMLLGLADAGSTALVSMSVGQREIEAALFKSYSLIKGILASGEKIVAEEILKSIVGGASQREVRDAIAERLQVRDKHGEMGEIPAWRAELIARNELSSNYRTVKHAAYLEVGFKYFQMTGPDDDRTAGDVCSKYLGQIHIIEEWEAIGEKEDAVDLFAYGFHVNCRHDWDAVPDDMAVKAT